MRGNGWGTLMEERARTTPTFRPVIGEREGGADVGLTLRVGPQTGKEELT